MKKTLMIIMLMATVAMQAQTSRLSFGMGGGLSTDMGSGQFSNKVCPMGTFNFGYAILDSVGGEGAMLGFRTGLNATYSRIGLTANGVSENFTNTDYYGSQMDYSVNIANLSYLQQQINLELPIMFAVEAKGLYFNVGAKIMTSVWNKFRQDLDNPTISAYYRDLGVTIVNDPSTGMLSAEQIKMVGTVKIPRLYVGLSAEIGYLWNISGNNKLGLDVFVDYVPWGFLGSENNNMSLVEISPIVNDCEQPKADVTVNPLVHCNNFNFQCFNAGLKLVYSFNINHAKKVCTDEEI